MAKAEPAVDRNVLHWPMEVMLTQMMKRVDGGFDVEMLQQYGVGGWELA